MAKERRRLLKLLSAGVGALVVVLGLAGAGPWLKQLFSGERPPSEISSTVKFRSRDSAEISAFLCRPARPGPFPAMIVIHEVFGVTNHIRDVACRVAREGYVAIAPDLYSREGGPGELSSPEAIGRVIQNLPDNRVLSDLDAALDYVKALDFVRGDKIGVIGFCMGGLYSLLFAGHSKDLAAAVVFYGRIVYAKTDERKPVSPIDTVPNIRCPLLGLFAEADQGIPVSDVKLLEDRLKKEDKTSEIKIYPGAVHGFFNDTRPDRYNPEAAKEAWERTLNFLRRYLS